LVIAQEAKTRLGLDEVLFIPAGHQWLKGRKLSPAGHRWEMLRLALKSNPCFKASRIEIDRQGPSYTVDTLSLLHQQREGDDFFFLLGWDALVELPSWKEPQRIIALCTLVALPRIGQPPDLKVLEEAIPGISGRVIFLEAPLIGISSTDIRGRVAQGLSIRYLVPEAVESYISAHALYK
jgi:nicotinate-nucleotide adenylyltransferase